MPTLPLASGCRNLEHNRSGTLNTLTRCRKFQTEQGDQVVGCQDVPSVRHRTTDICLHSKAAQQTRFQSSSLKEIQLYQKPRFLLPMAASSAILFTCHTFSPPSPPQCHHGFRHRSSCFLPTTCSVTSAFVSYHHCIQKHFFVPTHTTSQREMIIGEGAMFGTVSQKVRKETIA